MQWARCLTFCVIDLHGSPVQYREVQSHESPRFLSYFPHFVTLHGGVSSGFHHVSSPPPLDLRRLYHIKTVTMGHDGHGTHFITRQASQPLTTSTEISMKGLLKSLAISRLNVTPRAYETQKEMSLCLTKDRMYGSLIVKAARARNASGPPNS